MKRASLILLFAVAFIPAGIAVAQVQTGTPPFGTFGGGPDVIDLADLNSQLTIPVLKKAGRGMPFTFNLIYNSAVWAPVVSNGTTSWHPTGTWGWGESLFQMGYLSDRETLTQGSCTIGGRPGGKTETIYWYWTYYDSLGTAHPFVTPSGEFSSSCTGTTYYSFSNQQASDGSGYSLSMIGITFVSLTDRAGTNLTPPQFSGNGSATVEDRNGNEISETSSGVYTDTLGTTALTATGSSPNPITLSYTPPAGGTASYTVVYSPQTVQTNFACSGINEFPPTQESLVSEIDLPNGSKYTFTYESTPGDNHSPHYVTGRVYKVALPTGGEIQYTYSGGGSGVNGINCSDGSVASLSRDTPDGTWTYDHTLGSGAASTTTVTDPLGNQSVLNFQGIYLTERQDYNGSSTLLQTQTICYNSNLTGCNSAAVVLPITRRTITLQLPGTSNLECEHDYHYDSSGNITEVDDYDYGAGVVGPLIRKTLTAYETLGNITGFRQTLRVENGGGTVISQTNYNYDGTSVTSTSGTPQHVSVSTARGNLTSINYFVVGSTTLTKNMTYYDTGELATITDVNGASTTLSYGANSCGNSFPTGATLPDGSTISSAYNCTGGVQTSVTDENQQSNTLAFSDQFYWRPQSLTDPTSAVTTVNYLSETQKEVSLANNSQSALDGVTTLDSLGREHIKQVRQAPGSSTFDSVEIDYDSLGRQSRVSLPYAGTLGQLNSSGPGITTTLDPLSRPITVADSGNGTITYSYVQNDVSVQMNNAPPNENTKRKQYEYNAIGQLTSVCELTTGAGSGACGQTTRQTGFWTKFTYDVTGHLLTITQNAQSGSTQTRTYSYDLTGRLDEEQNPETGNTFYYYDSDSTCGNSSGDLVKKVDAIGNVTCYQYDNMHRLKSVTYPSGAYSSKTPGKYFVYNAATVDGQPMAHGEGRIVEAYTCFSPCSTKLTDLGFSYTVRGEVSDVYEMTSHSGGYYHVNSLYWPTGLAKQISGLSALPTITIGPDGEGRPLTVSASSGQNPMTNAAYNPAGLPISITFGSGDSDSYTYDPSTYRMTQSQFSVNGQNVTQTPQWNVNGSLKSVSITDPFNSLNAQSCSYQHDDLSRLASVNCGSWSQSFTYDAFGNIDKSGSQSFQPNYSSATNQMTSIGNYTPTYDGDGNLLSDPSHQYTWDSAGRPVTIDSVNLTFDAFGRIVEQAHSGAYKQIIYGPLGQKLAVFNGQTLQTAFVPLTSGAVVVYNGSGILYYGHADRLGSIPFASTPSRTMYFDLAYAPFGETYAEAGSGDPSFTGQRQDTVSGLYDFPAREYSTEGRWPSPDPAGLQSVTTEDPQTFNRYAYVRNSPLTLTDPSGACISWLSWTGLTDCDGPDGDGDGDDPCDPSQNAACGQLPQNTQSPVGTITVVISGNASELPGCPSYFPVDFPGYCSQLENFTPNTGGWDVVFSDFGNFAQGYAIGSLIQGNTNSQTTMADSCGSSDNPCLNSFAQAVFSQAYQQTSFLESGTFYAEWFGGSALLGSVGASVAAYSTADDLSLLGTRYILGENTFEANLYHSFPTSFIDDVVSEGYAVEGTEGYVQYNLPGYINDTFGVYQIGGYEVSDNLFYVTHFFFDDRLPLF